MKRTFIFTAALILILNSAAFSQPPSPMMPKLPRFFGNLPPEKGVWAEYRVVEKMSDRQSSMKLAIVGLEKENYWYEVRIEEGSNTNIIKMLLKGDPGDPDNIQRLIIKTGNNKAMEMPTDFIVMGRRMAQQMFESRSGDTSSTDDAPTIEEIGKREVTVPAGTFKTIRRQIKDGQGKIIGTFDFHADVRPIGVVLSETDDSTMELLAYGKDAVSLIVEEPVKIQPPQGMPGGPAPGMMVVPPPMPPMEQ